MLSGHILSKVLRDLYEITGTAFALYNRSGSLLACCPDEESGRCPKKEDVLSFLSSEADTMEVRSVSFAKISDEDRPVYVLAASGAHREMASRIAVSELTNLLSVSHEKTDRSRFIQNVLLDNLLPIDLKDDARKLKIRDDVPRTVFLVESSAADSSLALQTLQTLYTSTSSTNFIAPIDQTHTAVVRQLEPSDGEEERMKVAYTLADTLNTEAMISVRIAFGEPAGQLTQLSQSFKEAQVAMEVGRIFYPDRHVISYGKLGIGRLIYQLPTSLCEIFLKETFDQNIFDQLDDETITTIRIFFNNDLNISETARQLYIHRNTLVYRLEKLQKFCGLDIRKFEEAMTFKIAMMVNDYLKSTK